MSKIKSKNGITLIALIITILIMLILVAVTVSVVINSGLLDTAKRAGDDYKTAWNTESNIGNNNLDITYDGHSFSSIEELNRYIKDGTLPSTPTQEIHNWQREGDTLTCTCTQCVEANGAEGTVLTIGQRLDYDYEAAGGTGTTSITAAKSGIAQAKLDNQDWANGFGSSQTLNITEDEIYWVVLGRENTNGTGGYETLLLTTQSPTEDTIALYGANPYHYWIDEANRMARELYGSNARAMTIEDVNNCLQYTPAGGIYYDTNDAELTTGNFTTTLNQLEAIWTSLIGYGTYYPDSNQSSGYSLDEETGAPTLGAFPLDGYYYYLSEGNYLVTDADESDTTYPTTEATRNVIFGSSGDYGYWLASRGVGANIDYAYFGPGFVGYRWAGSYFQSYYSSDLTDYREYPFRAVVSLTSEIPEPLN